MRTQPPPSRHLGGAAPHPTPSGTHPDHSTDPRLVDILAKLLGPHSVALPPWSQRRWAATLAYPDLDPRPRRQTVQLGHRRDEALACPEVQALVSWAAWRRAPRYALAAAAAALATVAHAQTEPATDAEEVAVRVIAAVDAARAAQVASRCRGALLEDPDRLPASDVAPVVEDRTLSDALHALLRLAGSDPAAPSAGLVEVAVDQACRWWLAHTTPVPSSISGPRLPGIVPAAQLRTTARLSAVVPDPALRALVAGRAPGRQRSCQLAWREGLAFWVAARLAGDQQGRAVHPPDHVVRFWRAQLDLVSGPQRGATPAAGPSIAS